jgi:hypothetical protein
MIFGDLLVDLISLDFKTGPRYHAWKVMDLLSLNPVILVLDVYSKRPLAKG